VFQRGFARFLTIAVRDLWKRKGGAAERPTSKRPLHLSLEDWIQDKVCGATKREGWFNAIAYYAIRDMRYQKAEVCWSACVKKWKRVKPIRYPSFDDVVVGAINAPLLEISCDDLDPLDPRPRLDQTTQPQAERVFRPANRGWQPGQSGCASCGILRREKFPGECRHI
jgi:hypothetical protein